MFERIKSFFEFLSSPEKPLLGMRTDAVWNNNAGDTYIYPNNGENVLIKGINRYLNFGSLSGSTGYGLRDNGGTIEFKNSGGGWSSLIDGTGFLKADGSVVGATSQAQDFTNGVKTGKIFPSADSTTALQITKADGSTSIATFDTANGRLGLGITPEYTLHASSTSNTVAELRTTAASATATTAGSKLQLTQYDGAALGSGHILGQLIFASTINATAVSTGASIKATSTQAWSSGKQGTKLGFFVALNDTNTTFEAMTIDNTGNVGIGTTSPNFPLQISSSTSTDYSSALQFTNSGTGATATDGTKMGLGNTSDFYFVNQESTGKVVWKLNSGDRLVLQPDGSVGLGGSISSISTLAGSAIMVQGSTSNVGIGTTSPTALLHLNTTTGNTTELKLSSGSTISAGIYVADANDNLKIANYATGSSDDTKYSGIRFYTNNSLTNPVFGITRLGRIFIGSSSATRTITLDLSFNNDANKSFGIEPTATDVVGKALTIQAGSTVAGTAVDNVAGGNMIIKSGLGTGTGDSDIVFQTGRTLTTGKTLQTLTEALRIKGSGNVGIGTASPSYPLQIYNATKSYFALYTAESKNTAFAFQQGSGNGTTGNNSFFMGVDGNAADVNFGYGGGTNDILMATYYSSAFRNLLRFPIGTQNAIFYGNVGIGTTPTVKLDVLGSGRCYASGTNDTAQFKISNTADGAEFNFFAWGAGVAGTFLGTNKADGAAFYGATASNYFFGASNNVPIILGNNDTERMRIHTGGNIGIGITAPTAYLHIKAGTATASTAPLKLTAGTSLTVPEAGAIEFDGSDYYFTI